MACSLRPSPTAPGAAPGGAATGVGDRDGARAEGLTFPCRALPRHKR